MIPWATAFKLGYRNMMSQMGTDIIILWGGRTTLQAGGQRAGRWIQFNYDDVRAIQQDCYLVQHVTPELAGGQPLRSRFNAGLFSVHGIAPIYLQIRTMNAASGRPISRGGFRPGTEGVRAGRTSEAASSLPNARPSARRFSSETFRSRSSACWPKRSSTTIPITAWMRIRCSSPIPPWPGTFPTRAPSSVLAASTTSFSRPSRLMSTKGRSGR